MPQIGDGAGCCRPEQSLQLGEDLLDRIEVRAVGREVEQPRPGGLDGLTHTRHLVGLQVVEDDGVTGLEHGHERVGDAGPEACAVGGAVEQGRGAQAIAAQGGGDRGGLVVPVRDCKPAALAPRSPTVAACHVDGRGCLVEEDQPVGIEGVLVLEPSLAGRPYVLARLLGGVDRPFLRVMPCRAKKRDRLLVLVCTPCWARASRNSSRQDRRPRLVGRQDQVGLCLDPVRGVIATRRLGRELPLLAELFRPAAGTGHADTEPGCRLMTARAFRDSRHHTLAQIDGQG